MKQVTMTAAGEATSSGSSKLALLLALAMFLLVVDTSLMNVSISAVGHALQIALIVPILAGFLGLLNSFRMTRLQEPEPSAHAEEMVFG